MHNQLNKSNYDKFYNYQKNSIQIRNRMKRKPRIRADALQNSKFESDNFFSKRSNHARDPLNPIANHREAVSAISVCLAVQACNTRNILHPCRSIRCERCSTKRRPYPFTMIPCTSCVRPPSKAMKKSASIE